MRYQGGIPATSSSSRRKRKTQSSHPKSTHQHSVDRKIEVSLWRKGLRRKALSLGGTTSSFGHQTIWKIQRARNSPDAPFISNGWSKFVWNLMNVKLYLTRMYSTSMSERLSICQ